MNANLKNVLESLVEENKCAFLCAVDSTCEQQNECEQECNMLLQNVANDAKMTIEQVWDETYFITSKYGDFTDYEECEYESTI
jgi:hypothetical protein